MRTFIQLGSRLVRTWWFWAFALLALPNCGLPDGTGVFCDSESCCDGESCGTPDCPPSGCECTGPDCPCDPATDPTCEKTPPGPAFEAGLDPSDAIMCDIPVPVANPTLDNCATAAEAADPANFKTSQAATLLATGQWSSIALDWSAAATADCGGLPKKVALLAGVFPDGMTLCINCSSQIPMKYATTTKACVAECVDLVNGITTGFKPADVQSWCDANAHTSTNYDKTNCDPNFHGACVSGIPDPSFFDPRRHPDPIHWEDVIGTTGGGATDLTRTTPASGQNLTDWTEGAASFETITSGDAWIDFSSTTIDGAHAIGIRESRAAGDVACPDVTLCPDTDASLDDLGFAIDLNHLGQVYVLESVPAVATTYGPFGANYTVGERFRVHVTDNNDGTASISYGRISGTCDDGTICTEDVFYTSTAAPIRYPLRVDASFRDPSGFANVNIVRIKQ